VIGTLLNCITIFFGSLIGLKIGDRLPASMGDSIMNALGLITLIVGVQNGLRTGNILIPLIGILTGAILGELLDVDSALKRFGGWIQSRTAGNNASASVPAARARFINGFVTASLVFCVGPLAILGSIENGINPSRFQLLAIKSALDFFSSMAFAATLGVGVMFAIVPTIVIQGGFALLGWLLANAFTAGALALTGDNPYIRELTATGGLMLLGISLVLLNIKQVKVANLLPGLITTPLIVLFAGLLSINIYPL
jgi:uncharacterized membrane protein YqgA involved in biofilm formation